MVGVDDQLFRTILGAYNEHAFVLLPQQLHILAFVVLEELLDEAFENKDGVRVFLKLMLEVLALQFVDECNLFFVRFDIHQLHVLAVHFEPNFISH